MCLDLFYSLRCKAGRNTLDWLQLYCTVASKDISTKEPFYFQSHASVVRRTCSVGLQPKGPTVWLSKADVYCLLYHKAAAWRAAGWRCLEQSQPPFHKKLFLRLCFPTKAHILWLLVGRRLMKCIADLKTLKGNRQDLKNTPVMVRPVKSITHTVIVRGGTTNSLHPPPAGFLSVV